MCGTGTGGRVAHRLIEMERQVPVHGCRGILKRIDCGTVIYCYMTRIF